VYRVIQGMLMLSYTGYVDIVLYRVCWYCLIQGMFTCVIYLCIF